MLKILLTSNGCVFFLGGIRLGSCKFKEMESCSVLYGKLLNQYSKPANELYPPHSTGFTDSSGKVLSGRKRIEKEVNYFHPNLKCLCLSLQRLACDLHEDFVELFSMFAMSVLAVCLNRPRVMKKRRWKEGRREGEKEEVC